MDRQRFYEKLIDFMQVLSLPQTNIQQVVDIILKNTYAIFEAEIISLCVLTPNEQFFTEYRYRQEQLKIGIGEHYNNITRLMHPGQKLLYVPDLSIAAEYQNAWLTTVGIQSFVGLGLYNEASELIAVLFLNSHRPYTFENLEVELQIFQVVTDRLYRDAWSRLRFLISSETVASVQTAVHEWRQSLAQSLQTSLNALVDANLSLYIYREQQSEIQQVYAYSPQQGQVLSVALSPTLMQHLQSSKIIWDEQLEPEFQHEIERLLNEKTRDWIILPFMIPSPVGFILIESQIPEKLMLLRGDWLDYLPNQISLASSLQLLEYLLLLSQSSRFVHEHLEKNYQSAVDEILLWLSRSLQCSVWLEYPDLLGISTGTYVYPASSEPALSAPLNISEALFFRDKQELSQNHGVPFNQAWIQHQTVKSVALLPLLIDKSRNNFGFLALGFVRERLFDGLEQRILLAIADNISNSLQVHQILDSSSEESRRNSEKMREMLLAINSQEDAEPYKTIVDLVKHHYPMAEYVHLLRYEDLDGQIRLLLDDNASDGTQSEIGNETHVPRLVIEGDSVCHDAIVENRTIYVPDLDKYTGNYYRYHRDSLSELAIPIFDYKRNEQKELVKIPRGVLNMESTIRNAFDEIQVNAPSFNDFRDVIAIAWQNAERLVTNQMRKLLLQTVHNVGNQLIQNRDKITHRVLVDMLLANSISVFKKNIDIAKCELYFFENHKLISIYQAKRNDSGEIVGEAQKIQPELQSGIVYEVLKQAESGQSQRPAYVCQNTSRDSKYIPGSGDKDIMSEAAYALMGYDNQVKAILNIEAKQPNIFNAVILEALEIFVSEAEIGFSNWQLLERQNRDYFRNLGLVADGSIHGLRNDILLLNKHLPHLLQKIMPEHFPKLEKRRNITEASLARLIKRVEHRYTLIDKFKKIEAVISEYRPLSEILKHLSETFVARRKVNLNINHGISKPENIVLEVLGKSLEEALENIVRNGIEAMPNGGNLEISTELVSINNTEMLQIKIRDEGIGIPAEYIDEQIYWLGFSLKTKEKDEATKARKKKMNSGFGLFEAKWFINVNKGTITCKSILSQGTSFYVHLPFTRDQ